LGAVALLAPATVALACPAEPGGGVPRPDLAERTVDLVNAHRSAHGLAPLAVSPALQRAAQWKSGHMTAHDYFGHEDRGTDRDLTARAGACGYPDGPVTPPAAGMLAENIGLGYTTPEAATAGWVESPSHRRAIENAGYRVTGVGVAEGPDGRIRWTQLFGDAGPPGVGAAHGGGPGVEVIAPAGLLTRDGGDLQVRAAGEAAPSADPPVTRVLLGPRTQARVVRVPLGAAARSVRLHVVRAPRGLAVRVRGRALEVRRRDPATRGGRVVYEARRTGRAPVRGVVRVRAVPAPR
ncbi:MAG TPA: CAP domain-containing protein, partial [Miltoncostaeaceae bacterium]|nr:CAP domain-containing protein [Miltoncostaeaceae bacterium]